MKFTKVRNVKSPCRANKKDAGMDFFIPIDLKWEDLFNCNSYSFRGKHKPEDTVKCINIYPSNRILIPSGIHVDVPKGFALVAFNKSGVAHKQGLIVGSAVVDAGYQGEVHLSLINTTSNNVTIKAGDKIVQFILMPISSDMPEEVKSLKNLYKKKSSRGSGGFGSTNK